MGKGTHVCISLDAVKRALATGKWRDMHLMVGDRPATEDEIAHDVVEAIDKGYEVLPPCDHVDEKGRCKGHDKEDGE